MKLYECNNSLGHETFEYKEEQKGNIIEVTLKIELDTQWKSVQNYIDGCKNKQCLASKIIKKIDKDIKSKNERE